MQLNSTTLFKKTTLFFVLFCLTTSVFAQLNPFWSTGGNATANGAFLGTTNGEPLVFKTNNLEAMRIKANGEVKITSLSNLGKGGVMCWSHIVQRFCGTPEQSFLQKKRHYYSDRIGIQIFASLIAFMV